MYSVHAHIHMLCTENFRMGFSFIYKTRLQLQFCIKENELKPICSHLNIILHTLTNEKAFHPKNENDHYVLFVFRSDKLNFHLKLRTLQEIVYVCLTLEIACSFIWPILYINTRRTHLNNNNNNKNYIMLGNELVVRLLRQICWYAMRNAGRQLIICLAQKT